MKNTIDMLLGGGMSLILFSTRSMKLKEPLTRILITGLRDFFAVSFQHIETKKLSRSGTKVWGTVQDFGRVEIFYLAMV